MKPSLLILLALQSSACSGYIDKKAAQSTFAIVDNSRQAMQRTTDVEFARLATPGGLVQLEAFHIAYPRHRGFLGLLAEGYCQYTVGFVYPEWEDSFLGKAPEMLDRRRDRTLSALKHCQDLGLRMLGRNWQSHTTFEQWRGALAGAKKRHVSGLTWVALAMVNAIAVDPLKPKRLKELKIVEAILEKLIELDEAHNDAFAHLMLGGLSSSKPRFLGGNPEAGNRHFERARELAGPGFLMTDVLFARTYLVSQRDRKRFRTVLSAVVSSEPDGLEDKALANAIAIERARFYLASEDRLFGPES